MFSKLPRDPEGCICFECQQFLPTGVPNSAGKQRVHLVLTGNCKTDIQSAVQQKTLGKIQVFGTDDWKEVTLKVAASEN